MSMQFEDMVRCNQCMKVFHENEIIYGGDEDMEFCPRCGEGGCLMDLENPIKYKDFKQTDEYGMANVVEVFSAETGIEFEDDFPEEELDEMVVVETSCRSGFLSITLKQMKE